MQKVIGVFGNSAILNATGIRTLDNVGVAELCLMSR
jgi:hypothetical protein